MKSVCNQGLRGFKYRVCCQIKKTSLIENELHMDLKNLPVIMSKGYEYSPEHCKLYNLDDDLLKNLDSEEHRRVNCWFENCPNKGNMEMS